MHLADLVTGERGTMPVGNGLLLLALVVVGPPPPSHAPAANASRVHRSANFEVTAPTPEIARQIGLAAERLRKEKARLWLGEELPAWSRPCPITVKINMSRSSG